MRLKKLTVLFMGLTLALGITACSNRQPSGTSGNDSQPEIESDNGSAMDESQENDNSAADDSGQGDGSQEKDAPQGKQAGKNSNILIAYFSVPEDVDTGGTDAVAGASIVVKDNEKMGNTEYVAKLIQESVGGDLFRIETQQQYPLDHDPKWSKVLRVYCMYSV